MVRAKAFLHRARRQHSSFVLAPLILPPPRSPTFARGVLSRTSCAILPKHLPANHLAEDQTITTLMFLCPCRVSPLNLNTPRLVQPLPLPLRVPAAIVLFTV